MIVAETESMERIVVSGAALKDKLARITLTDVPDHPGVVAKVFHSIATHGIIVDDIIQTVPAKNRATVSFTIDLPDLSEAKEVIGKLCRSLECKVKFEDHLAKVSVVGMGMRIHTGVAERMFAALAEANINIQNITTSEIKISCLIDRDEGKRALRVVHDAFDLGKSTPTRKKARKKRKTGG
jgi:aspartate kinase